MRDMFRENALLLLGGAPLLHIDMIEPLLREHAVVEHAGEDGALIRETRTGAYMLSKCRPDTAERLLDMIKNPEFVIVHDRSSLDMALSKFGFGGYVEYVQAAYTRSEPPQAPELAKELIEEVNVTRPDGCISLPAAQADTADLARALLAEAINKALRDKWLPFAQAERGDEAAVYLFKELGMEVSPEPVFRLYNLR